MLSNNKNRLDILNIICRICAQESTASIHIFSDSGRKQNIVRKIQACLPINIYENDSFPKQICLTCLTKLDSFWDMYNLSKEAQIKIEKKFHSLRHPEIHTQENSTPIPEDIHCGICNEEVHDHQNGVGCDGPCRKWFHCLCINMTTKQYESLDSTKNWYCNDCPGKVPLPIKLLVAPPIEEKLRNLSECYPVSYGDSAVICLAPVTSTPPPPPQPSVTREAQVMSQAVTAGPAEPGMTPVTYLASTTAPPAVTAAPPAPVTEEVYPQALIQVPQNPVTDQPVLYQNRTIPAATSTPVSVPRRRTPVVPVPKPMSSVPATAQRPAPTPLKRRNGESPNGPLSKKCVYCHKYFHDDIIDHHMSLHLRQSFSTCLDCGKNFRSEEALEKHRCDPKETINLDPDDEEPIIV